MLELADNADLKSAGRNSVWVRVPLVAYFICEETHMLVIRENLYESNSSSMHSVVVTNTDDVVTHEEINGELWNDETIRVHKGKMNMWHIEEGYGRYPFVLLASFEDKLRYAMCEFLGCLYSDDLLFHERYEMFREICKELIDGFEDFDIRTMEYDIYRDSEGNEILHKDLCYEGYENGKEQYSYTGKDGQKYIATMDEEYCLESPDIGMIDHQSAGLLSGFLRKNNITLKDFLTHKKYNIVIDGDEYCEFQKWVRKGLINMDNIVECYPRSNI